MVWRRALAWAVVLLAVWGYATFVGLCLGIPPFTPLLVWNYSGSRTYHYTVPPTHARLKVRLKGELSQGEVVIEVGRGERVQLRRRFEGEFSRELVQRVRPGEYWIRLNFKDARGWVRLDWVSTKNPIP